ncbi:gluconeogenesis factor YvcK family protein [Actinopolymorpha pittospori]|uniref:Putative gluconeogenesis factor n=1 Tax=Actinopolymorpha pittospori TaxID=648752 RepID=A0A927MZE1_9ACTN|nr:uridine diphosphate-N-acetylglucosamine-binding protein YvcK [Actinopolymorpha pittospori]MBE1609386.1 putative cofD-like protein [Actinopolymorpha pittospori]
MSAPYAESAGPKIVALGGGHGLAASLSALRQVTERLTGVVTVADDGGSSGRLRSEFGVLPPGDLRKALAALCGDDEWGRTWAEVLQHRFTSDGDLAGHAVGNLLIVALWERLAERATGPLADSHVAGLDWVASLLGARGRVLPMCSVPLEITAQVEGLDPTDPAGVRTVRGQSEVARTTGRVRSVALEPSDPPACPEAVEAIRGADGVVLGPGSWFTSVLVHLLVPELAKALHETRARRVLTLNLAPQAGETRGFSPERHLEVLAAHAPDLRIDVVVADDAFVADQPALAAAAAQLGAELVVADVAWADGSPRHDPQRLARVYAKVLSG